MARSRNTLFLCLLATAWLALAVPAAAVDNVYQPAGVTATPRVPAAWNFYRDYSQATELLEQLAAAFPNHCRLESVGQSYGSREMWVLTITNFETGADTQKPAFWIDGGIHANEVQGTDVALYTAWYLLEMYEYNEFIRELVDGHAFYILPMISPDSRDAHFHEPNDSGSPRSGQVPVDDDLDGLVDEDGPDDLDGDGQIARMRKRDPSGRWKTNPDYPDALTRCEPDEPGEFLMLWDEGIDNDGDGQVNEDGDGYYDPNRDWAWHWQPRFVEGGAYRYPFSLPENRLAADFITAHPNIAGGQSYHNMAGMILRGPGDPDDRYPYEDIQLYDVIGKRGEEIMPGYKYSVTSEDLYPAYGLSKDWLYNMRGVLCFTNELWTSYKYFNREENEGWFGSHDERQEFDEYLLFGGGTIKWHEFEHPTYGTIELGGRIKSWGRMPPSFMIEEECHRNMAFTLYHADQLPQVSLRSVEVEELGNGLVQVTAVVANERLIPTHLAVDIQRHITRPDHVSLEGDGFEVLAASYSDSQFFEYPVEQRRQPQTVKVANIAGMSTVYVRWLVRGAKPEAVRLSSIKGGTDLMALPAG